jgi:hypothetical protein
MDQASRTAFRGLRRDAVLSLAKRVFDVQTPAWSPPGPQEGGKIERYIGNSAVAERLPGGQHVVVGSTIPLRVNNGAGLAPMSLTLHDDGEAYVPENPLASIAISTQASRLFQRALLKRLCSSATDYSTPTRRWTLTFWRNRGRMARRFPGSCAPRKAHRKRP